MLKDCEVCGLSHFDDRNCGKVKIIFIPKQPGDKVRRTSTGKWPYYYQKMPGMNLKEAQKWALDEMLRRGELVETTAASQRTGIINVRYTRKEKNDA